MGGGGDYYDRDVTDRRYRSSSGVSTVAQAAMSQRQIDKEFLPKDRKLVCTALNPLVKILDVTGSLGKLPQILYDKMPGIAGQILARKYLPDPQMSLCAVGDITSDRGPLQMADFSALRNLDRYFKRLWLEGNGGGQNFESYEMAAYFYAYRCEFPKAENPICLFTADEHFREDLYADDLREHFGGEHKDTKATKVFADLSKKFKGNVFLIHRYYENGGDAQIVSQWRNVLGPDRVVLMPRGTEGDLAIGDITLGLYAIASGARTLKQYIGDMGSRDLELGEGVKYEAQSKERITQVDKALEPLKNFKPIKSARSTNSGSSPKKPDKGKSGSGKKAGKDESWKV